MHDGGLLEVHDNVTFEANAAGFGGAVSLPFEIGSHLPDVALWVTFCKRVASIR